MRLDDALSIETSEAPARMWRVGTVTGTSGTKVAVSVDGSSLIIPRLTSYTPTVGDVVQIANPPGRPFVVGKIA